MSREKLFNKIGKRTRKHIHRAIRQNNINIKEIKDHSMMSEIYRLLKKTYKRARIPLADKSLFESAFDILQPAGMAKFFIARKNGSPAAGSVELMYKDTVYGWYQGFDRKYSKYNPNELLIWNILEWSSTNGYSTYDFGGAGRPDENYGVRDFKAKFGGTLYDFGRFNYIHSPIKLKLSKLGYRILRRYL
jgi:lipid II:glycine glycyltransferase (peptidoglycan interpeptide bridge formation enzyme)